MDSPADPKPKCSHIKLHNDRCIECGRHMSGVELRDYVSDGPVSSMNMILREELKNKKIKNDRVCLIFDLDNTCVHTLIIEGGEVVAIPSNVTVLTEIDRKSSRTVNDGDNVVHLVSLKTGSALVKIRGGIIPALRELSRDCDIGIFTMGTAGYASAIRDLLDPGHSLIKLGVYARDDCGATRAKDIRKLFEVNNNNILIWDDTSSAWPGHGQLLKCEGWCWKKFELFRHANRKSEPKDFSTPSKSAIYSAPPSSPMPPSLIMKQNFWPCVHRPKIHSWMYEEQLATMKRIFQGAATSVFSTKKSTSLILFETRRQVFAGLQFVYETKYLNNIKRVYAKYTNFDIKEYELSLMVVYFGGKLLSEDDGTSWVISDREIPERICVPQSWVFYSALLMRRIPLEAVTVKWETPCPQLSSPKGIITSGESKIIEETK